MGACRPVSRVRRAGTHPMSSAKVELGPGYFTKTHLRRPAVRCASCHRHELASRRQATRPGRHRGESVKHKRHESRPSGYKTSLHLSDSRSSFAGSRKNAQPAVQPGIRWRWASTGSGAAPPSTPCCRRRVPHKPVRAAFPDDAAPSSMANMSSRRSPLSSAL